MFGERARKAGSNCRSAEMSTPHTVYGRPTSSSMIAGLRPLGVFQVWSVIIVGSPAVVPALDRDTVQDDGPVAGRSTSPPSSGGAPAEPVQDVIGGMAGCSRKNSTSMFDGSEGG